MNKSAATQRPAAPEAGAVLYIIGDCAERIWNERPAERLEKAFSHKEVPRLVSREDVISHSGPVIMVRADAVLDVPVVQALVEKPEIVLLAGDGGQGGAVAAHAPAGTAVEILRYLEADTPDCLPAGFRAETTASLGASYWQALRKREIPYALRVTPENARLIEWRIFMGTYKGATDLVTKWLWPRPAFFATKLCVKIGATPNMVTWASLALVVLAFWLFWQGHWIAGLTAGWIMTFLDTVDGKLARVTLTSSKFGNALDHGIDLIHPPFWYAAWAAGLRNGPLALESVTLYTALAIILAGYLLQRALEGIAIWRFGIEIHIWRPVDTWFRQVTARRNPNLLILTGSTLLGRPDWGFIAVAWWTAICLVLHGVQVLQAWLTYRQTGNLTSWMSMAGPK